GVNIAARLQTLAEPGRICVSAAVRDQIGTKLPAAFADLGGQRLKNIAQPLQAFEVYGSGSELPGLAGARRGWAPRHRVAIGVATFAVVIARNSAFSYKGKPVDPKQIGRELGARYVLQGSIRRAGSQIRINAVLIDAETDTQLWAERFDRDIGDLFAVQNEITGRIARALQSQLAIAE